MRRRRIGDIVDAPTERINFEHAVALQARQNPHGEIKRTAGGATRRTCLLIIGSEGEISHVKRR
jgi:hypothetical protein